MSTLECKDIKEETTCKEREDCNWKNKNKKRKCTKRMKPKLQRTRSTLHSDEPSAATATSFSEMASSTKMSQFKAENTFSVCSQQNVEGPCEEYKKLLEDRKQLNEQIRIKNKECEEIRHKEIEEFFEKEGQTHRELLDVLFRFYKKINRQIEFQEFVRMFRRDTTNGNLNFKRQHVFEALCRLLLLFNYDDTFGTNKQMYKDLEHFVYESSSGKLEPNEILDMDINVGSAGGIVDIFFEQDPSSTKEINCKDDWVCDCKENIFTPEPDTNKRTFILIQNKYFDSEKAIEKDYDLPKMTILAHTKLPEESYKIVLMVNNSEALDKKMQKAKRSRKVDIYGVKEMSDWFYKLLNDFKRVRTIEEFFDEKLGDGERCLEKDEIKPKLHQMFFTKTTMEYHKQEYKLFIWGAVPRSGKSYMIGDFITQNCGKDKTNNDIVLILGAKTETESQFKSMFAGCSISRNYNIILAGDKSSKIGKEQKSIFILSQEFFKDKLQLNGTSWEFKNKHHIIKRLLSGSKKIDLFFDEIHKGGSTDKSQNILYAFKSADIQIDIFVMVTATFGKPSLRYETSFIDTKKKGIKLIEWGYEDQQLMKNIKTHTDIKSIINSRKLSDGEVEPIILQNIFDEYEERYGRENYLQVITDEYKNHPEIVIVQPDMSSLRHAEELYPKCAEIFKLKCSACDIHQSRHDISSPSNIFENEQSVIDLIRFIGNISGSSVDESCVYHKLSKMKAPIEQSHSEIWFLPDKDLYSKEEPCTNCKAVPIEYNQDDEMKKTKSLPNIEPLTRGLALLLMRQEYFQIRYNVMIIHNTDLKLEQRKTKKAYNKLFTRGNIFLFNNKENVSSQIKDAERITFAENKSLIILTGSKLRLGISLPCVDIAFNFDNISSIDSNYQTMFRVLTERQNQRKKYGYYVDLNRDRAIQFLYDYNNIYGSGKKLDVKKKTKHLQYLLYIFNYNGLGILKQDHIKTAGMYTKMIDMLKLDETSYNQYTMSGSGMATLFAKCMNFDYSLIQQLKQLRIIYGKQPKVKVVIKGKKKSTGNKGNKGDGDGDDDDDDELMDDNTFIQTFSVVIPAIATLLGMFTSNHSYSLEHNIIDCIRELSSLTDDTLCNCSNDASKMNIIACYMNSFKQKKSSKSDDEEEDEEEEPNTKPIVNKVTLIKLLEIILKILSNDKFDQIGIILKNIFEYIKETMGKHSGALIFRMSPEDIQSKIEEYLPVRKQEKEDFGEVFTPITLIDEMMDQIPSNVWRDPRLKWLDPASGIGNFQMIVYKRLMKSLPDSYHKDGIQYHSSSGKSEHILKRMLYMCEINSKNVQISRDAIFGSDSNICCCDFLLDETKWRKQFKMENLGDKFDIIIGNPPFNTSGENKNGTTAGRGTLWDKFIKKSLDILNEGGFLGFITPPGWRKPEDKLLSLMTDDNQMVYLHMYDIDQGKKLFKVGVRVDVYIIHRVRHHTTTRVIDIKEQKYTMDLSNMPFIPSCEFGIMSDIITDKENGIPIIYSTVYHASHRVGTKNPKPHALSTDEIGDYKYPVIHGLTKEGPVILFTNDKTRGHFGVSKVIVNLNPTPYPLNDYEGKYGMSELSFGIPITSKKQGDDIIKAITSERFKTFMKATVWATFAINWHTFQYLKPDFYKYFLQSSSSSPSSIAKREGSPKKKTRKGKRKGGKQTKRRYI